MKITIEFTEESIQKYMDTHLHEVLTNSIVGSSREEIRRFVIDTIKSRASEEILKAIIPGSSQIRQMVDQEVQRQARKLIGKMLVEPEIKAAEAMK